jgi:ABC-type transport system substrate-binding protein
MPTQGGEFREGIIGESKDIDKHLPRLINAGLTKYDKDKNIVGDIADRWEIKENGRVYEFHLREGFSSEDLANQILAKNLWPDITISTPEPSIITFSFKQSFSPFLYTSTAPIFPYGPYRIAKENKKEIELVANDSYYAGRPHINKIIIKLYGNQDDLIKAAKRGEIDGFGLSTDFPVIEKFLKFEMKLPRDLILFFNLSRPSLKDINVRKALKEGTSPGKELDLKLVTSDSPKNRELAKAMVEKWSANGIKITLDIKDNVTLQKEIFPKRDYDLLLYGLDYGEDPDPYPFWHSSQIKEDGRNLSNFKNTKADKLLEQARQEFDFAKREEEYAEFQKILDSEIPMFVVEHQNYFYQVAENIYGIEYIVGANEADRFLNVASWYMETKRIRK